MATLQDRIRQNAPQLQIGQSGQLQEQQVVPADAQPAQPGQQQGTGQLQQAAQGQGMPAPPTSQAVAGAMGINQHALKMVGSPAQVQASQQQSLSGAQPNAQRQNTQGQDTLSQASATQQQNSQATGQEQGLQQKSQSLQSLGGLGDRVEDLIQSQAASSANTSLTATQLNSSGQQAANTNSSAAPATTTPAGTLTGLPTDPTQLANLQTAASQYLSDPTNMQALLAINTALGRDPSTVVSPAEIEQLFPNLSGTGAASSIAQAGQSQFGSTLTTQDLITKGNLGYDLPTLSGLLNVPQDQLATMTVPQLQQAIASEQQAEFTRSQQSDTQAQSLQLGAAQRQSARQQGEQLSASGVRASEADMQKLTTSIQNADQVQFGGQQYSVEDLLGDGKISGIISDYMNAAPETSIRTDLEKTEPGLVQFIQNNQNVLQQAVQQMQTGATQFGTIQTQNAALSQVQPNLSIPDSVMQAAIPNWGKLSATAVDPNSVPLLAYTKSLDPTQQQNAVAAMTSLGQDPAVAQQLAGLSRDQLQKLELGLGTNSPEIQAFTQNQALVKQIQSTSPNDPDDVINLFTGGGFKDQASLQKAQATNSQLAALGVPVPDNSQFDLTPQQMLDQVQKGTSSATLQDILNGNVKTYQAPTFQPYSPDASLPPAQQAAITDVSGNATLMAAAAKGNITPTDVENAGLTEQQLYDIVSSGIANKWAGDGKAAGTVQSLLQNQIQGTTQDILQKIPDVNVNSVPPTATSLQTALSQVQQEQKDLQAAQATYTGGNAWQVDPTALSGRMSDLQNEQQSLQSLLSSVQNPGKPAQDNTITRNAPAFQNDLNTAYSKAVNGKTGDGGTGTGQQAAGMSYGQWLATPDGQAMVKQLMQQYGYSK